MECGDSQGEKRSHNWRNIKEKVAAVEEARLVGVRSVARKYGIPSSSISNWMKRETKLKQLLEQARVTTCTVHRTLRKILDTGTENEKYVKYSLFRSFNQCFFYVIGFSVFKRDNPTRFFFIIRTSLVY